MLNNIIEINKGILGKDYVTKEQANEFLNIYAKCKKVKFEYILTKDVYRFEDTKLLKKLNLLIDEQEGTSKISVNFKIGELLRQIVEKIIYDELESSDYSNRDVNWFKIFNNNHTDLVSKASYSVIRNIIGSKVIKYFTTEILNAYLLKSLFPMDRERIPSYGTCFAVNVFRNEIVDYIIKDYNIEDKDLEQLVREISLNHIMSSYKFDISKLDNSNKLYVISKIVRRTSELYTKNKTINFLKDDLHLDLKELDNVNNLARKFTVELLSNTTNKTVIYTKSILEKQVILETKLLEDEDVSDLNYFTEKQLDIVKELLNRE